MPELNSHAGHRRARDGDVERYSATTLQTYRVHANRWIRHATAAGIDPRLPAVSDLLAYFAAVHTSHGANRAQRAALGVAWYFRTEGVPNLIDDPRVDAVLWRSAPPENDPLGNAQIPAGATRRALRHAVGMYDEQTHYTYAMAAREWTRWASDRGANPTSPSVGLLRDYVATLASRYAFSTVKHKLCGISHYFRTAGTIDVTKDDRVRAVFEGVRREKLPRKTTPLFVDDVRKMVQTVDPRSPIGVRNALLLICMSLGGLACRHVKALDVANRQEFEDRVVFRTRLANMPNKTIGDCGDPTLSVKIWLARWLAIIGDQAGPLFPGSSQNGTFGQRPLRNQTIGTIVRRMAKRAGVWKPGVNATSLFAGFVVKAGEKVGAVSTALAAGYTSPRSVVEGFAASSEWAREQRLRNLRRKPKWRVNRRRDESSSELGA